MQIIRAAATDTVKGNAAYEIHEKRKETGRQRSDRHDPEKAGTLSEEASLQRGRYGLAVDVGTTTVVMELYELISGQRLSGLSRRNSQTLLGADVMMRLMHCQRGQQAKLEKLIRQQLEEMAEEICAGFCEPEQVERIVVVGNTTMCHILLGQDTSGLSGSPFCPAYRGIFRCQGSKLGMKRLREAQVIVPAGIDAHVGADAVAVISSLNFMEAPGNVLAVDIGTNAEIALSSHGRLTTCSAPAGPAFEGAQIEQGMRGEPGAIAGVKIARQIGNILLDVIPGPGREPLFVKGICGSGLIDAVAALRQCNVIRQDGYLLQSPSEEKLPPFLAERITDKGFMLYQSPEGKHVYLTQKDIRQFQLAKASVQAGIEMLLRRQEITLAQVDTLYIAGVFGGHISKRNAVLTGLFPDIAPEKLVIAGNAAGKGAAQALLSETFLEQTEWIGSHAGHVELAQQEEFQQQFMDAMAIVPW